MRQAIMPTIKTAAPNKTRNVRRLLMVIASASGVERGPLPYAPFWYWRTAAGAIARLYTGMRFPTDTDTRV